MTTARVVRLARRPRGLPDASTWSVADEPLPVLVAGQFLIAVELVSIDPAMRGWLDDRRSYLPPVGLGDVMRANAVGRVIESENPRFPVGAVVQGLLGVQSLVVSDGRGVSLVDTALGTAAMHLGVLGSTGLTAYFGLFEHGRPRAGDTVVVSGAAGAVGSVVGQLAKIAGCRTVGVAGGPEKCDLVTSEFGFDHAVDYRAGDLALALGDVCPRGIDLYFDNVGGPTLDAALSTLAFGARVVICGAISQYNASGRWSGPANYWNLLVSRATMTGFLVFDHTAQYPVARQRLAGWVASGEIVARETVVPGSVDDFNETFLRLFRGDNVGKLLLDITGEHG